jgi:hypothetical protein
MPVPNPKRPLITALMAMASALVLLLAPSLALAGDLLPDIVALPPSEIALEIAENGRHLLRFTQQFANAGPGPLQIHGVPTAEEGVMQGYQELLDGDGNVGRSLPISSIIFHPHHKHWHAGDVAAYELRRGSPWGPVAASNGKISYCLVDDEPYEAYSGPYVPPLYLNCETGTQGLGPGWIDKYEASLYDQWVDVTDLEDGVFYLVVTGDPKHIYTEADAGDWTNNMAWVKVELTDSLGGVRVMAHDEVLLRVNGERFDLPVHTRIRDDRAVAHVRLAERLGAAVAWDGTKVIVTKATRRLEITPGESTALVDGVPAEMGTAALMEDDRVLVPVRFLCEQLGATVGYDWMASTVIIGP